MLGCEKSRRDGHEVLGLVRGRVLCYKHIIFAALKLSALADLDFLALHLDHVSSVVLKHLLHAFLGFGFSLFSHYFLG